jgi:hypothetical protein
LALGPVSPRAWAFRRRIFHTALQPSECFTPAVNLFFGGKIHFSFSPTFRWVPGSRTNATILMVFSSSLFHDTTANKLHLLLRKYQNAERERALDV